MIVLTGATGGLGSQVLKHLLSLLPASEIIVSYSTASHPPTHLASTGVQLRHGDFAHPETLTAAFAGADALLLVSYPGIAHAQRVAMHTNAIDAAKRAGVRRVYYTSLAFASDSGAAVMQAHLETEAYLKQSGLVYTIMREGIYSESFPLYLGLSGLKIPQSCLLTLLRRILPAGEERERDCRPWRWGSRVGRDQRSRRRDSTIDCAGTSTR